VSSPFTPFFQQFMDTKKTQIKELILQRCEKYGIEKPTEETFVEYFK